jgi:hypothetical protein
MMPKWSRWLFVLLLLWLNHAAVCQQRLSAAEASNHIGQNATVCGKVASLHWAASSRGQPTFINLDEPYPRQIFTALIWGSDRPKFGNVEQKYSGKSICVSGTISSYRGAPQIILSNPEQITSGR